MAETLPAGEIQGRAGDDKHRATQRIVAGARQRLRDSRENLHRASLSAMRGQNRARRPLIRRATLARRAPARDDTATKGEPTMFRFSLAAALLLLAAGTGFAQQPKVIKDATEYNA
jgi:hypothetical protein